MMTVHYGDMTDSMNLTRIQPDEIEYKLEELVNDMMASDLKLMTKDQYLKDGGYRINNYFE